MKNRGGGLLKKVGLGQFTDLGGGGGGDWQEGGGGVCLRWWWWG